VSQADGLHQLISRKLEEIAAGYFPPAAEAGYVVPPALGQDAGICGALLISGMQSFCERLTNENAGEW